MLTRRRLLTLAAGTAAATFVPFSWASTQSIEEEGFVRIGGIDPAWRSGSWGAELGLHVVKRWPELLHVFVGTGRPRLVEALQKYVRPLAT